MNENDFVDAFREMRANSKQRKFTQSIELMVNFRGIDFKKAENQLDVRVNLPNATGRSTGKTLLFARDKNFISEMKGKVDRVIAESEIPAFKKKDIAQIAAEFDGLVAEGPVMIAIGKYLGQDLAPKGKMPKPVQADVNSALQALKQMSSFTRVTNKKGKFMPVVQVVVGSEKMDDKQLAENCMSVFDSVVAVLPGKLYNVRSVYVKETMGPAIKVGKKEVQEQ